MEKTEILALIDKAIKGQGTNVDAGGALATILEGIMDSIPQKKIIRASLPSSIEQEPLSDVLGLMKLTEAEFYELFNPDIDVVLVSVVDADEVLWLNRITLRRNPAGGLGAVFGGKGNNDVEGAQFEIFVDEGIVDGFLNEV